LPDRPWTWNSWDLNLLRKPFPVLKARTTTRLSQTTMPMEYCPIRADKRHAPPSSQLEEETDLQPFRASCGRIWPQIDLDGRHPECEEGTPRARTSPLPTIEDLIALGRLPETETGQAGMDSHEPVSCEERPPLDPVRDGHQSRQSSVVEGVPHHPHYRSARNRNGPNERTLQSMRRGN
jgi:hypothetical protein